MYYKATIYFILLPRGMSIMTIEGTCNILFTDCQFNHIYLF